MSLYQKNSSSQSQRVVKLAIAGIGCKVPFQIDTDIAKELPGRQVVPLRRLDIQRGAVQCQQPAIMPKLVALGMASEIVMVVQHQDFRAPALVISFAGGCAGVKRRKRT